MLNSQNIVVISKSEFNRIKSLDLDKLIKSLVQIYGDEIKQIIVEGFTFKIEND